MGVVEGEVGLSICRCAGGSEDERPPPNTFIGVLISKCGVVGEVCLSI